MKNRNKKQIILKRMKKFLKFFWKMNEDRKKEFMQTARNIFSTHDTFMQKIES